MQNQISPNGRRIEISQFYLRLSADDDAIW